MYVRTRTAVAITNNPARLVNLPFCSPVSGKAGLLLSFSDEILTSVGVFSVVTVVASVVVVVEVSITSSVDVEVTVGASVVPSVVTVGASVVPSVFTVGASVVR